MLETLQKYKVDKTPQSCVTCYLYMKQTTADDRPEVMKRVQQRNTQKYKRDQHYCQLVLKSNEQPGVISI